VRLEFNFVATTYSNYKHELERELKALLHEFEPIVFLSFNINSVTYGKLNGDPVKASERLWNLAHIDPWKIRRILRFVPIAFNCPLDVIKIKEIAKRLGNSMPSDASYKIEAEIRLSKITRNKIIEIIAEEVDRKVNLEKPDYILEVQIIDNSCGISVLKDRMIFKSLEAKLEGSYFP